MERGGKVGVCVCKDSKKGGRRDNMDEGEEIYVSERLSEEKRAQLVMYEAGGVDEEVAVGRGFGEEITSATQNSSYRATSPTKLIDGATLPRVLQETEKPENSTTTYTT